jgi:hypothetical protein
VRTIKLFAVIGLAVALMGALVVPALAEDKTVTVTCQNNQIDRVDPEKVEVRLGDTLRWVLRTAGCPSGLAGGKIKISFADKSPFDVRDIEQTVGQAGQPLPPNVETAKKEIKNIGQFAYTVSFLAADGKEIATKDGRALVVVATPTLTEWGLIALAVLLAGGMGYMIYRRRPALRPAAP